MENNQNIKIALVVVTLLIIMITSVVTTIIIYQLLMEIRDTNEKSTKIYNRLNQEVIQYDIEGVYNLYNPNSEAISYKFDNGKVKYEALFWMEGTYEIIENKIRITYEEAFDPGGEPLEDFEKEEELTIINNNILMSKREVDGKITYSKYRKEK